MDDLRVLVVAADPLARAGLATLLEGQPGCTVVGGEPADADLAGVAGLYRPDVVLWDLGWDPEQELESSLEHLVNLTDTGLAVVVLLPDETHAAEVQAAEASGLLFRDAEAETLLMALRAAASGLVILDRALAAGDLFRREEGGERLIEELTPREVEVLQLLADGLTNKGIGQQLGISDHTVKFHVNSILGKLGAQSRTEAVVRATRLGLIIL
jgi:two-component system nitrate/nitrite response regulator NarL